MARPCKKRKVCLELKSGYFCPEEFSESGLVEIVLEADEIEAVRLADLDGEYQDVAAKKMGVSRSTFSNIIIRAHQKIAEALIQGKAIRINCPKLVKKMQRMGKRHE